MSADPNSTAYFGRYQQRTERAMDFARELYEAAQPVLDMEVIHRALETAPTQVPIPGTTVQSPAGLASRAVSLSRNSTPTRGRNLGDGAGLPVRGARAGAGGGTGRRVWVGETGRVVDVAIVESAGELLDTAVLEGVAGWQFTPARLRGVAVSVRITFQNLFRR